MGHAQRADDRQSDLLPGHRIRYRAGTEVPGFPLTDVARPDCSLVRPVLGRCACRRSRTARGRRAARRRARRVWLQMVWRDIDISIVRIHSDSLED